MFEPLDPSPEVRVSRAVILYLVAIFALIGVGFVVGLRQGTPVPQLPGAIEVAAPNLPGAVPATHYREFDRRTFGANRDWQSALADLVQPETAPAEREGPSASVDPELQRLLADGETRAAYLQARAGRRAFDGAPPVVPHPIDQVATSSCLACHGQGLYIGKQVWAPPMSHPVYQNCTQCHVEAISTEYPLATTPANHFEGKSTPGRGTRAWDGAPPTIPHTTWMRENCLSCHGARGANPIQTSHPWRAACLQCHAPSAKLDQMLLE